MEDIRRLVSFVNWHLTPRDLHSLHDAVSVASHYVCCQTPPQGKKKKKERKKKKKKKKKKRKQEKEKKKKLFYKKKTKERKEKKRKKRMMALRIVFESRGERVGVTSTNLNFPLPTRIAGWILPPLPVGSLCLSARQGLHSAGSTALRRGHLRVRPRGNRVRAVGMVVVWRRTTAVRLGLRAHRIGIAVVRMEAAHGHWRVRCVMGRIQHRGVIGVAVAVVTSSLVGAAHDLQSAGCRTWFVAAWAVWPLFRPGMVADAVTPESRVHAGGGNGFPRGCRTRGGKGERSNSGNSAREGKDRVLVRIVASA